MAFEKQNNNMYGKQCIKSITNTVITHTKMSDTQTLDTQIMITILETNNFQQPNNGHLIIWDT